MRIPFFKGISPLALLCFLFLNLSVRAQTFQNVEELKKEAAKLFDDDDFTKAYSLYSQLVSTYPKDPEYNYRLGVCMLYSEANKKKCFSYLKIAANHPKDAPKDAKFYLAKAYHINYQFDEAIKLYNQYKLIGSPAQQKKLQVDREIKACQNGKRLLATMEELVVMNKKQLNEADYFRSYDLSSIGGKLLVKPEEFKTAYDKKKKDKSVIYIPKSGDKIYYSSYGENGSNGRDIYMALRLPNGSFAKPQPVPGVNTEFDEDYPFLHPNGKTLYFSSKGHNSMGGYDIFKTTYNESSNTWSAPVNMEFPINSPDDDYLFVTDTSEKIAYFSTGRQSPPGKIDVLKINTERRPMEMAVIKGTVVKEDANQSVESKITVKNLENGKVISVFNAEANGDYYMELPNGGKFIFTVETPGIPTQSDKVSLPVAYSLKPFKQSVSYDKQVLKIINYFDSPPDDNSYLNYIDLIEKKAKLEVNEDAVKNSTVMPVVVNENTNAVNTNNPTIISENNPNNTNANNTNTAPTNTITSKEGLSNTQLLDIAKTDAKEAKAEADKMKQDEWDATEIGNGKKIEANKLQKEADEAMTNANAITDENQKKVALEKAIAIKNEADNATKVADAILSLAKNLGEDAKIKEKEVSLNEQYAKELESVIKNKNNKEALAKLEDLSKQIEEISKQKKQSDITYGAIKSDYDQKQNQIAKAEEKSNKLKNDIEELKKEININETELAKTKDKTLKQNLTGQIGEEKIDLENKNKELAQNEIAIKNLKEEGNALQNEMDIANKIKTTDSATPIANNNSNNNTGNDNNGNNNTEVLSFNKVSDKYNSKLENINNANDKAGLEESTKILNDYNKEVKDLIALDKIDLKNAKTADEKKKINDEIKQLEKQQQINTNKIAANNTKIKQIDSGTNVAANNNNTNANNTNNTNATNTNTVSGNTNNTIAISNTVASNSNNNPINNNNTGNGATPMSIKFDGSDDINKLTELKNNIDNTNNPAFNYKDYKEASSQSLKLDAEFKLQTANTTKNELSNSISAAQEDLKNNPPVNAAMAEVLNDKAINMQKKATNIRIEAESYQGADKENMLKEAKLFEGQANKKHLEASEITKGLNEKQFNINKENLDNLIAAKKGDVNAAEKLNEEAKAAFKQAKTIRDEANSMGSDAAKLGTITNAEEKEADALAKQKEAVDLLMKSNKNFALKTLDGSNPALAKVSEQYDKLNKEKMDAYMALSKTNQNEIKLLLAKLNANPAIKKNTNKKAVEYKKAGEFINRDALAFISKAVAEADLAQKQNLLLEANKKEIEVLTNLNNAFLELEGKSPVENPIANNTTGNENTTGNNNAVNTNTTSTENKNTTGNSNVAANTNTTSSENNTTGNNNNAANTNTTSTENNNNTAGNNNVATNTNTTSTENNTTGNNNNATNTNTTSTGNNTTGNNNIAANTNTTATNNNNTTGNNNNAANENNTTGNNNVASNTNTTSTENTNSGPPLNTSQVYNQLKDTTLKSIINYLDKNTITLKNADANTLKNTAFNNLKTLSEEAVKVEEQVNSSSAPMTETDVKNNISTISKEAEENNKKAVNLRIEAESYQGTDKENMQKEAKDLEAKSNNGKLQAADLQKKLNDAQFNLNIETINALLAKAKAQNGTEVAQAEELINLANTSKKQATTMRDEVNGLPAAAKIGGYSNAEEKESDMLMKQMQVISLLRKYYPDYVAKEVNLASNNSIDNASPELKDKYNSVSKNEIGELEKIYQAFLMEYESTSAKIPATLNNQQKLNKTNAVNLIGEAKNYKTREDAASNLDQKKELIGQATKKAQEAIISLNKIGVGTAVAANNTNPRNNNNSNTGNNNVAANNNTNRNNTNNTTGNNTNPRNNTNNNTGNNTVAANNTNRNNANNTAGNNTNPRNNANNNAANNTNPRNNTNENTTNANATVIKVQGLEVKTANAYSANNPIPIDAKVQDGLIFRVQIGAFKSPLPNGTFKGLSPVNAQTTPNGYIRYTAGNFEAFEIANAVKNDLRNLGYKDAFVVGYYNGQRITVSEAVAILQKEGKPVDLTSNNTAGINQNANVPRNTVVENTPDNINPAENVVITNELEKMNGLLFTVQIGVYSKQITKSQLYNLQPIYTERLPSGLYRYTAGIYNNAQRLLDDKGKVVNLGVRDAFVSAYFNSKRVPFADGEKIKQDSSANVKMETENPIIFPSGETLNANPTNNVTPANNNPPANSNNAATFSNGVTSGPAPTPENGVKTDEAGISFKVQIGAYTNKIPNEAAAKFMNIKTWPVVNKQINSLYIYTIGNFTEVKFAKNLKAEANSLGINDAFVTVYKDGKKLYGTEAAAYLNR